MAFEKQYGLSIAATGLGGGQAVAYVHNVRKHLSWIDGTKVGRLLLKAIAWHVRNNPGNLAGGVMTIQPYTGADCNATVNNSTNTATGWSQPTVNYSPGVFNHGAACHAQLKKAATNRGLYPDEILFHELVHGLRGAAARFRGLPVSGGLAGYNGTEEFIAVLATNIYVSDPSNGSKTGLRRDHTGFAKLEPALAGSLDFFRSSKNAFTLVDQFCKENPAFTKWLSEVKAPFNPIAAYYGDQAKAQRYSNSAVALVRDGDWAGLIAGFVAGTLTP